MAFAIWITGIPGSGKSTISRKLAKKMDAKVLRLDEIRKFVTPSPSYSKEEKLMVYRFLAYLGKTLVDSGINIIFDATDELGEGRKNARKLIRDFRVIALRCDVTVCAERERARTDSAGMNALYRRAKAGKIRLAGVNAPYKIEMKPWMAIDTSITSPEQAVKIIMEKVK